MEEQNLPSFSIPLLDGSALLSANWNDRKILVFWATWCSPCSIELGRLNKMILDKKIKNAESVVAISSYEEIALLKAETAKRNYQFKIGIDLSGSVAEQFKIAGTPTIIFVNEKAKINWITTGLSPSLEVRASNFLNQP
jgi:thiol-disulfide isomerase/thioredoxin